MALSVKYARHLQRVLKDEQATKVRILLPDHNYISATEIVDVDEVTNEMVCTGSLFVYCGSGRFEPQEGTHYVSLEQIRSANHDGKQ